MDYNLYNSKLVLGSWKYQDYQYCYPFNKKGNIKLYEERTEAAYFSVKDDFKNLYFQEKYRQDIG